MRKKYLYVALSCIAVAFLLWQPITRAIILFILPLGRGIDDFIVIAALIFGAVFFIWSRFSKKGKER